MREFSNQPNPKNEGLSKYLECSQTNELNLKIQEVSKLLNTYIKAIPVLPPEF